MSETTTTSPLTVVLVHGAFADSSSWTGVIERLQASRVRRPAVDRRQHRRTAEVTLRRAGTSPLAECNRPCGSNGATATGFQPWNCDCRMRCALQRGEEVKIVSRGFEGRRRQPGSGLIPPGQYLVEDFPVLTAGPTPFTQRDDWDFSIVDETGSVAALDLGIAAL